MFLKKFGKKIFICFCLVTLLTCAVFFCLNRPKTVKAEPVTVGLTLGAVVMAFLAASGVAISSSGIDENNLDSSLSTMLSGYEKSDLTYEDWVNNIGDYDGLDWLIGRENKAGAVAIGYELMDWLSGLPSWLIGTYGLSSSGDSTIVQGGTNIMIGNTSLLYYPYQSTLEVPLNSVIPSIIDLSQNGDFSLNVNNVNIPYHVNIQYSNGGYRGSVSFDSSSISTSGTITINTTNYNNNLPQYVNGVCISSNYSGSLIFGKISRDRVNNTDTTNCRVGTSSAVFNVSGTTSITGGMTGTIDDDYYQDYQDAVLPDINAQTGNDDAVGVIDLGAGVAEGALTQEQLIQNILDAVYANELDSTWTGVYEDQKTAEEDTDSEKVPTEAELQGNMVIIDGLEDFFPFCIPFDLYEIIAILNVPAETPQFTYTVSFGGFFGSEDLEIDLSDFETPALIVRTMFIIAFLVFLTLKTRDLIRG